MTQRNYLVSTIALSTTPSGTTIGSGNTTSATFALARTMVLTGIPAGELAGGSLTWSIHYAVEAMTTPYEMRFKLQRLNSSGVMQTESNYGSVRSATGTFDDDITWDSGTWVANDQLAVVWEHRRPSGTGSKNGTVTANGSSWVDAPTLPSASLSPSASISPSSSVSPSLSPSASQSPSSSSSPSISPSSSESPSSSTSPSISPSSSQSPSSSISPSSSSSPSLSPSASVSPSSSTSPSLSPSSSASPSSSISPSISPSSSVSPSSSESPSVSPSSSISPSSSASLSLSPSTSDSPSASVSPSISPSASLSPSSSESASVSPSSSESVSASPSISPSSSVSPSPPPPPPDIVFIDPGGDAVQAIGYFQTQVPGSGGIISFDTAQKVNGVGSYKFDSDDDGDNPHVTVAGVMGATRRVSTWFRYDSIPDATSTVSEFVGAFEPYSGNGPLTPDGFTNALDMADNDGVYATATPVKNSGQGTAFGSIGLASGSTGRIPNEAAIKSVKIRYERKYDVNTSIGISRVKYRIDGVEGPNHDNTDMPLTDTVVEVDVTGDRESWARSELADGVFEVIAEARRGDTDTEHTQSWDYVEVEVEYFIPFSILAAVGTGEINFALVPSGDGVILRFIDADKVWYDGITVLLPDTDHRISWSYVVHSTDLVDVKLYLNGIQELAIEDAKATAISTANLTDFEYGWRLTPGENHICWFDQIYIDEGDDLSDPGNILSTAKLPTTVNEDNWDTTGGTGAVNERPLSDTNYREHAAFIDMQYQTYNLQSASAGDINISSESLVGYMGWAWAQRSGSDLDVASLVVNGAEANRLSQLASTPRFIRLPITSISYPANARGIGMYVETQFNGLTMFECGVVIAYEGPSPDIILPLQLLAEDSSTPVTDDLRADPPDSYEFCYRVDETPAFVTIDIYSLSAGDQSPQFRARIESDGGDSGRARIEPGIEVTAVVEVTGGDATVELRHRLNVD